MEQWPWQVGRGDKTDRVDEHDQQSLVVWKDVCHGEVFTPISLA